MNDEQREKQASQLELAARITRENLPWEFYHNEIGMSSGWIPGSASSLTSVLSEGFEIRIKAAEFPALPEGQEWHNPDGLTADQVEVREGWRLLIHGEPAERDTDEIWYRSDWVVVFGYHGEKAGLDYTISTRTKRPLPEPPKPEPAVELIPLGPEDVPVGSLIRHPSWPEWKAIMVIAPNPDGVWAHNFFGFEALFIQGYLYRTSRATEWAPCSKPKV